MKVFLDTNIILDLLLEREGFEDSIELFSWQDEGKLHLCTSVLSMVNIAYVYRKTSFGNCPGICLISLEEAKKKKDEGTLISIGVNEEQRFIYDVEKSTKSFTVYSAKRRSRGMLNMTTKKYETYESTGMAYVAISSDKQTMITFEAKTDPNTITDKVYYKRISYEDIPSNNSNGNWDFLKKHTKTILMRGITIRKALDRAK